MKIALITIHCVNNYGAILQAYATQITFSKYGDVEIINYNNRHASRSFDLIRISASIHGVMGTIKDVLRFFPRRRAIRKFRQFISNNVVQTSAYKASELMRGLAGTYDVYVAGSDQIWNPGCVSSNKVLDDIYFLGFTPGNSRKISYASSIGGHKFSAAEELLVKKYLRKFGSISVREKSTQVYLQGLLGKPVQHVLDPTLLLDKTEWLRVAGLGSEVIPDERYILLYTVPKVPLIKKVVEKFSKKFRIKVVAIDQGLTTGVKVDRQIRDAGPKEFLKLFACAEFIVTDSFHGVCFSINFERPFVAVSSKAHSNRIESLLNLVGLEDRLIDNELQIKDIKIEHSYSCAYEMLSIEREKSLEFIAESLK